MLNLCREAGSGRGRQTEWNTSPSTLSPERGRRKEVRDESNEEQTSAEVLNSFGSSRALVVRGEVRFRALLQMMRARRRWALQFKFTSYNLELSAICWNAQLKLPLISFFPLDSPRVATMYRTLKHQPLARLFCEQLFKVLHSGMDSKGRESLREQIWKTISFRL